MAALTDRLRKNADWLGCNYDDICDDMRQSADRIEKLEAALDWYADQMCEGLCEGKDPKACASIGADNCAGCPAVVALAS